MDFNPKFTAILILALMLMCGGAYKLVYQSTTAPLYTSDGDMGETDLTIISRTPSPSSRKPFPTDYPFHADESGLTPDSLQENEIYTLTCTMSNERGQYLSLSQINYTEFTIHIHNKKFICELRTSQQ